MLTSFTMFSLLCRSSPLCAFPMKSIRPSRLKGLLSSSIRGFGATATPPPSAVSPAADRDFVSAVSAEFLSTCSSFPKSFEA
jgi:hypothetical protein